MNTYKKIVITSGGGSSTAENTSYDNSGSGLSATNVQDAIDELAASSGSIAYVESFIVGDWVLNVSVYELEILEATHGKGAAPLMQIYQDNAGTFEEVQTGIEMSSGGDIVLTVSSSPDLRFAGKIIIK